MSSLAATQADGMYIPPEYLESGAYKKKSLNQYNKSKGHNQFLQRNVCRFELPFDGFCTGCNEIVGKGTRFNAHKAHVDDYFTTKIYEFTTRCRKCGEIEFRIRTNPKERTFDYVSGIRKKVEEFDSAEAGTHGVIDTELGNGILQYRNGKIQGDDQTTSVSTSLNLLERNVAGHRKVQTEHEHMESLLELNSWKDEDADANAAVRASFRKDRKAKRSRLKDATSLGLGRGIELKGSTADDANAAKYTMDMHKRHKISGNAHQLEKDKFGSVRSGSIFSQQKKKKKSSKRKSSQKKAASSPQTVGNKKKESNDDNAKKPVPQKRKIIIHNKQITSVQTRTKKQEEEESSPDGGALTALSNLYASDSD